MTIPVRTAVFASAEEHFQAGRLAQAEGVLRHMLAHTPGQPDALHLLGLVLHRRGEGYEAVQMLGQAIAARPDAPVYYLNLGLVLRDLGMPDDAQSCFRSAADLAPGLAQAHFLLGLELHKSGRLQDAAGCYRRAVAADPAHAAAHNNLGVALRALGAPEEAARCHRAAIALEPGNAEACNNLGLACRDLEKTQDAVLWHRKAVALRPDSSALQFNLGVVLDDLGVPDQSAEAYRAAVRLRPDYAEAHHNLGLALLTGGALAEGWREYEWRWQAPDMAACRRNFPQPQWRGGDVAGKTLLIHAEQGFGDTLQFCRYVPLAAALGAKVVLEVQQPLMRLLSGLPGAERVVPSGGELPAFDLHCPMLSLPLAFRTGLETVTASLRYIQAPTVQTAYWAERLATALPPGQPRVGLVWAGMARLNSPRAVAVDRRRSMAAEHLRPLFDVGGISYVSLQKSGTPALGDLPLLDVMGEMSDFADTAALIESLDLVISVDTAVAHLAAALGKPVWLLDRADPCWRWLRGRDDSPWYPSLKIFRQTDAGDWVPVIRRVAEALTERFVRGR